MKRKIKIITLLLLCVAWTANAQKFTEHVQQKSQGQGSVVLHESAEITELVNGKEQPQQQEQKPQPTVTPEKTAPTKPVATASADTTAVKHRKVVGYETAKTDADSGEIDLSKKVIRNGYKVTGYRIQVYAGGNSREDKARANSIGKRIKLSFPDQPVYTHFYSPRWICRMGNFRTYEEASEMLKEVKRMGYPQACIVKGKITVAR